jgi:RHS repeat-associated protein
MARWFSDNSSSGADDECGVLHFPRLSPVTRRALLALIALVLLLVPGCKCGSERDPHSGPHAIDAVPEDAVFYLNDHQGTPVVVTDAYGVVVRSLAHEPYGSVRFEHGTHDPHGYVGRERDSGSGLSHFGARPYRPEAGIFLAPDPVAVFEPEQLLNTPAALAPYAYAVGDPINLKDATGRMPTNAYEYISENFIGPKLPPAAKAEVDANRPKAWWTTVEIFSYASLARAGVGLARYSVRLATSPPVRRGALQAAKLAWAGAKDRIALIGSKGKSAGHLLRSVRVPRDIAARHMISKGIPAGDAPSKALSFSGPVNVSVMQKGRKLLRYTGEPTSKGHFFTDAMYSTSRDAVTNLNLAPWRNPATFRQPVTSAQRTIALEGGVANGGADATQTFVQNWDALMFEMGKTF